MAEEKRWKREDPAKVQARRKKYAQAHHVQLNIALIDNTDQDIIDFLATVTSKRGFVLAAIRKAMEEQKNNPAE